VRDPSWWWRPPSWSSRALAPLGSIYGSIAARRLRKAGEDIGVPVVCVGNYHTGGAGKTPTVLALLGLLKRTGERPFAISRGYGGKLRGPVLVEAEGHSAKDVGDEPLLLAAASPVVVSRDRVAAARFAGARGASVIVMDDGFQNPALAKHFSMIVVDGLRGIGNGFVFPAGPLRAPLEPQIERTEVLVIVGEGSAADGVADAVSSRGGLIVRARLEPEPSSVAALQGKRVLAFAGIGDPERFFRTLRASGIEVGAVRSFADHHRYSESEIAGLVAEASGQGLALVTTTKDLVRLGAQPGAVSDRGIVAFAVTLAFDREAELLQLLRAAIAEKRAQGELR
jgi:tetraacyldisaccharide 4'-kinase